MEWWENATEWSGKSLIRDSLEVQEFPEINPINSLEIPGSVSVPGLWERPQPGIPGCSRQLHLSPTRNSSLIPGRLGQNSGKIPIFPRIRQVLGLQRDPGLVVELGSARPSLKSSSAPKAKEGALEFHS